MEILNQQYNILFNNESGEFYNHQYDYKELMLNSNMADFAYMCENLVLNIDSFNYKYVVNMANAFFGCPNIIGSSHCGDNVTNFNNTYISCYNLIGNPVCGNNVIDMSYAYGGCDNITGVPVCGPNVTNMSGTYYACYNLTGPLVCGNNVINMSGTYEYCCFYNGAPVCGPNVTDMWQTYFYCNNLRGNMFMQSDNVINTVDMLAYTNDNLRINIYVRPNTTTNATIYNQRVTQRESCWWNYSDNCYYSTARNIYVYYNWNGVIW